MTSPFFILAEFAVPQVHSVQFLCNSIH